MAISEKFGYTATVGATEYSFTGNTASLQANTDDGVYQGFFDVNLIGNGDVFRFRIYEKAISGGTQRIIMEAIIRDIQGEPIFVTPSMILLHGWDMTWFKVSGTDRSIIGSIRQVV